MKMTPDDYINRRVDGIMALIREHHRIGLEPAAEAIKQLAQDRAAALRDAELAKAERNQLEVKLRREYADQIKGVETKYSDLYNKTHIYDDDAGGMVLRQDIEAMHRARVEAERDDLLRRLVPGAIGQNNGCGLSADGSGCNTMSELAQAKALIAELRS